MHLEMYVSSGESYKQVDEWNKSLITTQFVYHVTMADTLHLHFSYAHQNFALHSIGLNVMNMIWIVILKIAKDNVKQSMLRCCTALEHSLCRNDTDTHQTATHKLVSWWVTLPITESNAWQWLSACVKPVSHSIQCWTLEENEGKREREKSVGWARLTCNERESGALRCQFISLSRQKQFMLLLHYRDTSQAGIISSSMSVNLTLVNVMSSQN